MTAPKRKGASAGGAGPSKIAGNQVKRSAKYTKSAASATVTKFQSERITRRRFAAVRLKEIYTLAMFRRREGFTVDGNRFASALAFTLACDRPGRVLIPGKAEDRGELRPVPWVGLSLETLRRAIVSAELGEFEDAELFSIIADVERWRAEHGPRLATAKRLGLDLALTAIERDACGIRTIEAVDESKAERQARLRAAKLTRDRETKRAKRGRIPREIYEGNSLSKLRPWEAEGIGRRAWEKRRAKQFASVALTIDGKPAPHLRTESVADPSSTDRPSRGVARGCRGTEDHAPKSEMERSVIDSYGPESISARSRGLDVSLMSTEQGAIPSRVSDASRMFQKKAPTMKFDPSAAIASLIEVGAVLSELAAKTQGAEGERFEKLSASVGMFQLLLEVSVESQPDDGADILTMGIDHLAPRLRAANDNRLSALAQRLAA